MDGHRGSAKMTKTKAHVVRTTGKPWSSKPTRGKIQFAPKLNSILSFQCVSLLVSNLSIFLHGFDVLEVI